MVVAAAAADVAVEPAACEEAPLLVVPDPLLVGEPPLLDEVGEGDCEVVVVGLCDDEVGVGEEDVVVGAAPLPDDATCRLLSTSMSLVTAATCYEEKKKRRKNRKSGTPAQCWCLYTATDGMSHTMTVPESGTDVSYQSRKKGFCSLLPSTLRIILDSSNSTRQVKYEGITFFTAVFFSSKGGLGTCMNKDAGKGG